MRDNFFGPWGYLGRSFSALAPLRLQVNQQFTKQVFEQESESKLMFPSEMLCCRVNNV
jgi:hypothetical protein